ncbi:hypothetical protein ABE527_14205 [Brucella sp. TWI432]
MNADCQKCGGVFSLNRLDAKPRLTPWLWLVKLFFGQNHMLRYAADRGCDFTELLCEKCYGPGFEALPDNEEGDTIYLNHYRCDECDTEWDDEWNCMCNDRCPGCNAETEPFDSEEIGGEER